MNHPLHLKALALAKQYTSYERELLSALMEMDDKRVFYSLGYAGVFAYCVGALSFSESQASYFATVLRKSREVPELKIAIDNGVLNLSKARRIVPVITRESSALWIGRAASLTQRELEVQVAAVNPRAVQERLRPVSIDRHELRVGLTEANRVKWQRAVNLISRKKRQSVSLETALESLLEHFLEKNDPVRKAQRSFLRKGEPSLKSQVALRDRGVCSVDGCANTRFLEVHHIRPKARGGGDSLANLTTLCSGHHKVAHTSNSASTGA